MSPQMFDCFLRSPVLTITSKNHFSSSQEGWPADEAALLQLGGNTDNHSKWALQQGLYHGSRLSQDVCASWHRWRTKSGTLEKVPSGPKQFNGPWEMSHCHWNQDKLCTQNQDKLPLGDRGDSTLTNTKSTMQSTAAFPSSNTHQYSDP